MHYLESQMTHCFSVLDSKYVRNVPWCFLNKLFCKLNIVFLKKHTIYAISFIFMESLGGYTDFCVIVLLFWQQEVLYQ